jgi:hypothetical protein
MGRKGPDNSPDDEIETIELDEAVSMCTAKVMTKMAPTISAVEGLQRDVTTNATTLNTIQANVESVKQELLLAIDALPKDAPAIDPTQLQAAIGPLVKTEVQATFRQVLLQFGVSKETVDSGDINRTIGEILPKAMMMMAGNDALSKLKKPTGKTEEIGGEQTPAKPTPPPRRSVSDEEMYGYQHRCQCCNADLGKIKSAENECPKCGQLNYAYRCGHCKEVIVTILSPDMIAGSECPLCGTKFKR